MISSCIRYEGSKKEMEELYKIHEFIPKSIYSRPFASPFFGSGVVEFNHMKASGYHSTFINDINGDVIHFWKTIRKNRDEFEAKLKYIWVHQDNGKYGLDINDCVERAVLFYINHQNINHFTKSVHLQKDLDLWSSLLNRGHVVFFNSDYKKFMKIVAKTHETNPNVENVRDRHVKFYCDPPYHGTKARTYESDAFDLREFYALCQSFLKKKHFFLISYYDCPLVRELFTPERGWYIKKFDIKSKKTSKDRTEILISNEPFKRRFIKKGLKKYTKGGMTNG